jgi:hypothetical protein
MQSGTKRERVRRAALAVMAVTAPMPVVGVALDGTGLPWAILPAAAGVVTVATSTAKRSPAPIPAPIEYPEQVTVQVSVIPDPEPDLNALRALIVNGVGR